MSLGITGGFYNSATANELLLNETFDDTPNTITTSPVDKIFLGLLPLAFRDTFEQFIKRINHYVIKDDRKSLIELWYDLRSTTAVNPIIMQRAIRGTLIQYHRSITNNVNKKHKPSNQNKTSPPVK